VGGTEEECLLGSPRPTGEKFGKGRIGKRQRVDAAARIPNSRGQARFRNDYMPEPPPRFTAQTLGNRR
jgi:hypothetical protein